MVETPKMERKAFISSWYGGSLDSHGSSYTNILNKLFQTLYNTLPCDR